VVVKLHYTGPANRITRPTRQKNYGNKKSHDRVIEDSILCDVTLRRWVKCSGRFEGTSSLHLPILKVHDRCTVENAASKTTRNGPENESCLKTA